MTLDDTPHSHKQFVNGRLSACSPVCVECERVREFGRRETWVEVFNLAEEFGQVEGDATHFGSFLEVLRGRAERARSRAPVDLDDCPECGGITGSARYSGVPCPICGGGR